MSVSPRLYCPSPLVWMTALILTAVACGAPPVEVSLEFLADFNAPSGIAFAQLGDPSALAESADPDDEPTTRAESRQRKADGGFGGVSALSYDPSSGLLYALSDSTNLRVFVLSIQLSERSLKVEPEAVLPLLDASGVPLPLWTVDPEGLAMASTGELIVSSEGYASRDPRVDPGIFRFGPDGRLLGSLPIPPHYLPRDTTGVRNNLSFESLTVSPDGATLLAATERNLQQDEHECDASVGCLVRILRYGQQADGWQPIAEYFYRTDPSILSSLGLAELLWVRDRTVLTLERGFERLEDGSTLQTVRVYQIELPDRLSQSELQAPLAKRLVLDLDSVKDRFSEGFRRLDNYEGMCFGPQLPNGDRTLLIVSDDNYSNQQRTSFLAFRLHAD
ncbi:MAG: esterase-like activity of phytase family protein [Acidobacteria bacterium]|nr:esterase-like activity of phytase family protein [Acidobacteriota bacterium]MDA1234925.1 esterase-like activity of phytase family protein [Acidobacteriota bacterium]